MIRVAYYPSHWDENWRDIDRTFPEIESVQRLYPHSRLPKFGSTVLLLPETNHLELLTEPLWTFNHPEVAVYVCGPSHRNLDEHDLEQQQIRPDAIVHIPAAGDFMLASHAMYIVLADRNNKKWQSETFSNQ